MEAIKTSVTNSPAETEIKGKVEKKSGKRIGYNYIIIKSLKESQKNDVVKCLYIKSLINFGICVIKEGTYGDTKDKQGRDIKDRLMWQKELHEKLQGKVRLPRLLGSFEENGNYYLVLERIRGKSLYKVLTENKRELRESLINGGKLGKKFLNFLIQIIELVEILHKHKVVHRDVTAANFMITPAGKVAVIDMELSYSLEKNFPSPPFQLGTYGYMSPEQERTEMPAVEQDVFSVGAILLQVWSNISPSKIVNESYDLLVEKTKFFIPDIDFAKIVADCFHPDPLLRPSLEQIKRVVSSYKQNLGNKPACHSSGVAMYTRNDMLEVIQQSINTISSPLMADEQKGWFSENSNVAQVDKKKINKGWYSSFYKGACGIIYMLSKAHALNFDTTSARQHIDSALLLIDSKYLNKGDEVKSGLHFGSSGIAATMATAMLTGLINPKTEYFEWINQLLDKNNRNLTLQNGVAGQGIAHMVCQPFLLHEILEKRHKSYVAQILNDQQKDGSWSRTVKDNKNRSTRGFAKGVAGIVYYLLEFSKHYRDDDAQSAALKGLHWLMKKIIHKRNGVIQWNSSDGKDIGPWWCEGSAGISLTFLNGYTVTGDIRYKEIVVSALNNFESRIVDNNLTQCHGLSGLGEIYLEVFAKLHEEEFLMRAEWIAQVLMQMKKREQKLGAYWLTEHERHPTADFMTGNSGVVHFLLRYCQQEKMGFPLLTF